MGIENEYLYLTMFIHLDDAEGNEIGVIGIDYDLDLLRNMLDSLAQYSRFA